MLPPKELSAHSAARSLSHWIISRFIPRQRSRLTRSSLSVSGGFHLQAAADAGFPSCRARLYTPGHAVSCSLCHLTGHHTPSVTKVLLPPPLISLSPGPLLACSALLAAPCHSCLPLHSQLCKLLLRHAPGVLIVPTPS
ncbi:hypothetical protein NDU88_000762 [Pleurodeles waltl]|uniref:Uncharacterized protein n=1 Tax=Pleurodeles waltl TaxID=8319 RepID=A0AAV7US19_PLEWA|nr:hypothetical protein NDU88_000762 [Pleurodeles waltl]